MKLFFGRVRWYCQFALSYRDLVLMVEERGLSASHTTIMRWVHQYAPELNNRMKKHLKLTNDSWKIDETYLTPISTKLKPSPNLKFHSRTRLNKKLKHSGLYPPFLFVEF